MCIWSVRSHQLSPFLGSEWEKIELFHVNKTLKSLKSKQIHLFFSIYWRIEGIKGGSHMTRTQRWALELNLDASPCLGSIYGDGLSWLERDFWRLCIFEEDWWSNEEEELNQSCIQKKKMMMMEKTLETVWIWWLIESFNNRFKWICMIANAWGLAPYMKRNSCWGSTKSFLVVWTESMLMFHQSLCCKRKLVQKTNHFWGNTHILMGRHKSGGWTMDLPMLIWPKYSVTKHGEVHICFLSMLTNLIQNHCSQEKTGRQLNHFCPC